MSLVRSLSLALDRRKHSNYSGGVSEAVDFQQSVDFASVANAMGCVGIRVERPADVKPALDKALSCGRPAVVEVLTDPTVRAKRGRVPPAVSGE